jgi:hypothetical protein
MHPEHDHARPREGSSRRPTNAGLPAASATPQLEHVAGRLGTTSFHA